VTLVLQFDYWMFGLQTLIYVSRVKSGLKSNLPKAVHQLKLFLASWTPRVASNYM